MDLATECSSLRPIVSGKALAIPKKKKGKLKYNIFVTVSDVAGYTPCTCLLFVYLFTLCVLVYSLCTGLLFVYVEDDSADSLTWRVTIFEYFRFFPTFAKRKSQH